MSTQSSDGDKKSKSDGNRDGDGMEIETKHGDGDKESKSDPLSSLRHTYIFSSIEFYKDYN